MLLWAAGARIPEVEEALWQLDGHHTVTGVLTKLPKPSVPVNLVGHKSASHYVWVPASRGSIHFLCVIMWHFRWVRADSGGDVFFTKYGGPTYWSQQSGETFFCEILVARPMGPRCQVEESLFCA